MYRSEQAFSKSFLTMIKKHCGIVQRIESGTTGRGIPDIYCRFQSVEQWIELKNDNRQSIYNAVYEIHWRPGQRGWHYEYYTVSGRVVLTICAMRDGYVVVPLRRLLKNPVSAKDCYICTKLSDLWLIIKEFI